MPVKLRRLWIQLTSDRKRFGLLCAVLGVAMLLWARLIVVSRMPRMALADEPALIAAHEGSPSSGIVQDGVGPAGQAQFSAPIAVTLDAHATRDPFVISPRYFPRPTSIGNLGVATDKSSPNAVEEPMQVEARITAQLRALTEKLRLEAAVNGSVAVINGRTYRMGDVVAASGDTAESQSISFRLVEVSQRSAVLEYEERRFEIRMIAP